MTSLQPLDPALTVLQQFFHAATEHASAAVQKWTRGTVSLSLDEVIKVPFEEVAPALGMGAELLTMIVHGISGDEGGQMILTFDDANGRRLAASLLGKEPSTSESPWTPLEQSALMETGNIVSSTYLGELGRLTGRLLLPTMGLQDCIEAAIESKS